MKKHFLQSFLILILFAFLSSAYAQIDLNWKWMHPKPQGNTLRYVKVFSPTSMVAVGYAGTFISTSNGGTSWNVYANAGSEQAWGLGKSLYSGWFFNATTGLACGSSGWIARTTNGGASWDSISSGGSTATLYGIHFINSTTGFIGGTSGTVLKTTDAGLSWNAITTGFTSSVYNIFATDVDHIYAPTSSSGLLQYTTNGGTNWVSASTGGTTLYDANFINANTGFVCGSSGHVKLTTNGGVNWTSINVPSVTSAYYDMYVGSTTVTPFDESFTGTTFPPTGWRTVNVSGPTVFVRSTAQYHSSPASAFINYDCSTFGTDWLITPQIHINAGDSISFWLRTQDVGWIPDSLCVRVSTTDTALSSFTTRVMYLAEGAGYNGNTWTKYGTSMNAFAGQNVYIGFKHADDCGDGIYLDDIHVGPTVGGTVPVLYVVGDPFAIYKTQDYGASWSPININSPTQVWTSTYYSMDMNGSTMATVGASGLINMSTNSGTNWTNFNTWLLAGTFYDVWAQYNNGKVIAVGSGSNDTKIIMSNNGGNTWQAVDIPTSKYFRTISMVNPNTGFIAGSSGGVYRTTNGGTNWDSLPFPGTNLIYQADFVSAQTGWVVSSSSAYVYKTVDGGMNWASQTGPTGAVYGVDMIDANTGYIVGTGGSIRKTTDGGTTWTSLTPNTSSTLYAVKMLNANTGYITGSSVLRRTTNGGTSWDTVSVPYSTTMYGMDWTSLVVGMLAGSSTGFTCRTVDGGLTWAIETTSGSTMYNLHMTHHDSAWAVGSIQGVYKWAKGMVGNITWTGKVPGEYYLSQNYPNPFNPSTTINFGIPKSGKVSLNVYDITGRLVTTLLNNAPLNPGNVTVKFDGSNIASGVYFYTLTVDNNRIDTKKMILVK